MATITVETAKAEITLDPIRIEVSDGIIGQESTWSVTLLRRYDSHYVIDKAWERKGYIIEDDRELRQFVTEELFTAIERFGSVDVEFTEKEIEE